MAAGGDEHPNGQIGLARFKGCQSARQSFVSNAQARRWVERQKAFAQFHHHRSGNDAVDGDRQDRLPASGHAFDAVGQCVHILEQSFGFSQKFLTCFGGFGLPAASVKQQHIQSIFNLADSVGEGAGDEAQLSGGRRKASRFLNGEQHAQGIWGEEVAR